MNYIKEAILRRFMSHGKPEAWDLQPYHESIIESVYDRFSGTKQSVSKKKIKKNINKLIKKGLIMYDWDNYSHKYLYVTTKGERKLNKGKK